MELSVVLVSYNTKELLAQCLDSFLPDLPDRSEVIVVDNASDDGSAELLRSRYSQVRLLLNEDNRGFAAAINQGIQESPGEVIFVLNPDTVILEGAAGTMVGCLSRGPKVAIVGPQLLYPDGGFQHSAFHFPNLAMAFLDLFPINHRLINSRLNGRYPRALYQKGEPFPIDHPLGAAFMVRREAIDQVGLMDEDFFMYCEEIDWCMRLKRAGWQILCHPGARIVHYAAQSTSQNWGPMYVELHRSRYRLYKKHYSSLFVSLVRLVVGLGIRREMLKARRTANRGELSQKELEERLNTYREVLKLR